MVCLFVCWLHLEISLNNFTIRLPDDADDVEKQPMLLLLLASGRHLTRLIDAVVVVVLARS